MDSEYSQRQSYYTDEIYKRTKLGLEINIYIL